jgi:hypothetical protein
LKGGISAFCAWNQPPIIHFLLGTRDLWFFPFAFSRVRGELRLGGGKSVINEDNILAFSLSRRWKSLLSLAAGMPRESDERRKFGKILSSRCGKANIPARNRGRKQHETRFVAQLIVDTTHSRHILRFILFFWQ